MPTLTNVPRNAKDTKDAKELRAEKPDKPEKSEKSEKSDESESEGLVSFTARLDQEMLERLDAERAGVGRELGFTVSRSDMLARIVKIYFARKTAKR
jgi:hypothetical protein